MTPVAATLLIWLRCPHRHREAFWTVPPQFRSHWIARPVGVLPKLAWFPPDFPEIPARNRVALSRFWSRCTDELLKERHRINVDLASAQSRRTQRNQTSAGRRPIQGRKENLRWLQVVAPLQALLVRGEITRYEAARCLDKLNFDFDSYYPRSKSALASRQTYEDVDLPARKRGRLKTFLDAQRLQAALEREKRRGTLPSDLPRDAPWRFIEKKLSDAKRIALHKKVLSVPTVKDLVELHPPLTPVLFSTSGVRKRQERGRMSWHPIAVVIYV